MAQPDVSRCCRISATILDCRLSRIDKHPSRLANVEPTWIWKPWMKLNQMPNACKFNWINEDCLCIEIFRKTKLIGNNCLGKKWICFAFDCSFPPDKSTPWDTHIQTHTNTVTQPNVGYWHRFDMKYIFREQLRSSVHIEQIELYCMYEASLAFGFWLVESREERYDPFSFPQKRFHYLLNVWLCEPQSPLVA